MIVTGYFLIEASLTRGDTSYSGEFNGERIVWERSIEPTAFDTEKEALDALDTLVSDMSKNKDWVGSVTLHVIESQCVLDERGDVIDHMQPETIKFIDLGFNC